MTKAAELGRVAGRLDNQPLYGGTLGLVGGGDVDHLDPALAYHTVTRGLMRACTRQLVTCRSTADHGRAGEVIADLAVDAVGPYDDEGRRYRFVLKDGVRWDVGAAGRQITATDVARGIKRLAHPMAPSPGLQYFLSTIDGLVEFRDALLGVEYRVDAIADFIETHSVRGLVVEDERSISITTVNPSPDFLNILSLPFATPAPLEYLHHVPGNPELEQRLISNGPYRIVEYRPGAGIRLERNRFWERASDGARMAYVDTIDVVEGMSEVRSYERVMSGHADMLWDTQPPTETLAALFESNDPRLEICQAGLLSPYLVINFLSPNEGNATSDSDVRLALRAAINKRAVSDIWGGPRLNAIAHQILPPLSAAHRDRRRWATVGDLGDAGLARKLLQQAGYGDGLTLKLVFRNRDIHPATAEAVAADLDRAGIRVELVPAAIDEFFIDYVGSAAAAREGAWDIALTGWEPDWYGNNARVYLQALFDSSNVSDNDDWGTNFGHYRSERTNSLLAAALNCSDEQRANRWFQQAEDEILGDTAVVPILFAHQYWLRSSRVRNWLPYPVLNGDLTNIWLSGP
jgi:peptide/nickel transport system substrate-binding protein